MAPIPVYTNSPIAASKPSGVTPQTAQPPSDSKPTATRTSPTSASQPSYPPAQPGAAPSLPTPTAAASHAYVPPQPRQAHDHDGPPPPQPGAVPTPPTALTTNIPPPPRAGEEHQMPYPPQMSIPPPTVPYPSQQRGTSTPFAPPSAASTQGPIASNAPAHRNLEHPPGYYQNANASELDRYQSSAIQQSESEDRRDDSGGVWETAKKWAQHTGEKIAAAENEVWKKINKE
ncbi:hypothetical protein F5Y05DRAFT_5968 [Hypoxylon sp. FL0543]|nr:hypothetical protein F5Y05DRAFT_5968 [Hypoxylon sp. FL0543]